MVVGEHLARALSMARLALLFGQVRRVTLHGDGERESDTTHTVMLALLAIETAPRVGCDAGLAAQFAIVHDLPETYAGDTNTAHGLTAAEAEAKAGREAAAMQRLTLDLDDAHVLDLLRRYEAQQEPEARLVRYLDKVLPKLTHYLNGGAALRSLGLTAADVMEKHAHQGAQLAEQYPELAQVRLLFSAACWLVEQGIRDGDVRVAAKAADDHIVAEIEERRRAERRYEAAVTRTPGAPHLHTHLANDSGHRVVTLDGTQVGYVAGPSPHDKFTRRRRWRGIFGSERETIDTGAPRMEEARRGICIEYLRRLEREVASEINLARALLMHFWPHAGRVSAALGELRRNMLRGEETPHRTQQVAHDLIAALAGGTG